MKLYTDWVGTVFQTNVVVYLLLELENGKMTAELVRRSVGRYPTTINMNL